MGVLVHRVAFARHSREGGNPWTLECGTWPMMSGHKSRHDGLASSINRTFQARFHFLIRFSRWMADSIVGCSSNHTSLVTSYCRVKPGTTCSRCCQTLATRSLVTPAYKVPLRPLASRYT